MPPSPGFSRALNPGYGVASMTRTREWVYAWLLLAPAMALLVLFTHYPAVANLWHSFLSTPKGSRPAVWVGADNYAQLLEDPIFWQALQNNFWYALGTIPVSIALALLMAVWVHGKIAGRGFLRLAYFTPTVLPMIAVANIWLFFYTPEYGLIEQVTSRSACGPQLARQQVHRARRADGRDRVEGSRDFS